MSKKYTKLLFVILSFYLRMKRVERNANEHIEVIETEANRRLRELVDKQIEADQIALDNWQDNTEELWQELERVKQENKKLKEEIDRLERELRY